MKLIAYHAASGDCLLLTGNEGHNVLVDGGRVGPYEDHIRAELGALREADAKIDLLYVSHVDNDHVSGILKLLGDEVAWRKHEFDLQSDPGARPPRVERPPEIAQVWHNALFELIGDGADHEVGELAAALAGIVGGDPTADLAHSLENIATGFKEGMEISRRISDHHLGLDLNPPANGGLLERTDPGPTLTLGEMEIFLLGPSADDIEELRHEWSGWLTNAATTLESLHDRLRRDEEELGAFDPAAIAAPDIGLALGDGSISEENLASIMLLVEENDESILLSGDGSSEEILTGLEHHGKIAPAGQAGDSLHVNVLKVQHHGAEANVTEEFVRRVTADHYVFCGNGAHHNPEISVIEGFAHARLNGFDGSGALGPDQDFTFWFTSSKDTPGIADTTVARPQMIAVHEKVDELVAASGGRMHATFIEGGHVQVWPTGADPDPDPHD